MNLSLRIVRTRAAALFGCALVALAAAPAQA